MPDTIVIAVDGMEPSLVQKWCGEGYLPNIEQMCSNGFSETVECRTVSSAVQWTNHFTGVTSETHGVSSFTKRGVDTGYTKERRSPDPERLINLNDINVKTYPEILDKRGISVGLINPLVLWPPLELDHGFCISGMVTPPDGETWVHPEARLEKLESFDYRIDIKYPDRPYGFLDDELLNDVTLDQLWDDIYSLMTARIEYTKYAIEEDDVDFIYSLIKSLDSIQHLFWAHMDSETTEYQNCIKECYMMVDDLFAWIMTNHPESNVIAFSDHGFGPRADAPGVIGTLAHYIAKALPRVPPIVEKWYSKFVRFEPGFDLESPDKLTGDHSRPAILFGSGPDLTPATGLSVKFEDITPTLLTLAGQSVPTSYYGSPITEIMTTSPSFSDESLSVSRERSIASDEIVSERLHHLGYADLVED